MRLWGVLTTLQDATTDANVQDRAAAVRSLPQHSTGYDAAIKETGRLTDDKIELDEEALTALDMKYQLLMDALMMHRKSPLPTSSLMSGRLAANI